MPCSRDNTNSQVIGVAFSSPPPLIEIQSDVRLHHDPSHADHHWSNNCRLEATTRQKNVQEPHKTVGVVNTRACAKSIQRNCSLHANPIAEKNYKCRTKRLEIMERQGKTRKDKVDPACSDKKWVWPDESGFQQTVVCLLIQKLQLVWIVSVRRLHDYPVFRALS